MTTRPLPARPFPVRGESRSSFLARAAAANGFSKNKLPQLYPSSALNGSRTSSTRDERVELAIGVPASQWGELLRPVRGRDADLLCDAFTCPECDAAGITDQYRTRSLAAICELHNRFLHNGERPDEPLPVPPAAAFAAQRGVQEAIHRRYLDPVLLVPFNPRRWLAGPLPAHWQPLEPLIAQQRQLHDPIVNPFLPNSPVLLALAFDVLWRAAQRIHSSIESDDGQVPRDDLPPDQLWAAAVARSTGLDLDALPACIRCFPRGCFECSASFARRIVLIGHDPRADVRESAQQILIQRGRYRPMKIVQGYLRWQCSTNPVNYGARYRNLYQARYGALPPRVRDWQTSSISELGDISHVAPAIPREILDRLKGYRRHIARDTAARWLAVTLLSESTDLMDHRQLASRSVVLPQRGLATEDKMLLLDYGLELVGEKTPAWIKELAYPQTARVRDSREAG